MYCERCKHLFDGTGRCPNCGTKQTRAPRQEDLCYLTQTDPMFGGMLKDVLEQNRIPVLTSSALGAGMALKVGPMFDQVSFYVPYPCYSAASELVEGLFQAAEPDENDDW